MLNSVCELELLYNNSEVDFMEAYMDVKLQHLNLYNRDQSIEGKLVLKKKNGVPFVQCKLRWLNAIYKYYITPSTCLSLNTCKHYWRIEQATSMLGYVGY